MADSSPPPVASPPPLAESPAAVPAGPAQLRDVGEHAFFELAEHAPVMIWVSNTAMQLEYANRAWLEFNGMAEVPREDKDWLRRIHPDDAAEMLSIATQALQSGANYRVATRIRNTEGQYRWILSEARPRHDVQGRPIGYIGCCTDVTDIRRAREELQQAEERLRLVMEGSRDAAWDWNIVTNDFYYSPRWWQMLGMEPDALPVDNNTWERRLHPDDRSRVVQLFVDAYEREIDRFETEFRLQHLDGHYVPLLCRGLVLRDKQKNPVRVSGVNTDLTERKESERERRRLEEQLREGQKMQAIGTLAGGIAHDFNNIAGAILGNVELARQDADGSPEILRSLTQIREAAERARGLTRQILAFSRRQATNREAFAVRPRIEAIRQLLRETLLAPVTLECQFAPDAPAVLADPVQFDQALINLLTNAAQSLENRPGRIDILVDAADPPADVPGHEDMAPQKFTRIRILDTGCGMDADTLQHVFEPFFTTKPVDRGTGLGLSVVYGILQAHGGSVTAHSAPGVGSTFTLLFPAATGPMPTVPPQTAGRPFPAATRSRILYVDDDPALLSMVQRLLDRRGHRVTVADSGAAALAQLQADPGAFDLLLVDYNMPVMKGTDVARDARRLRPDLPIALASGFVTDALLAEARELDIPEVIFKANAVAEFCEAVDRLVRPSAGKGNSNEDLNLA